MGRDSDDTEDHKVGYKKPPKHSQYKKGQSGNPRGRPKGTKNFKTDLMEELSEQVIISEGGKQMPVSKQRALIKRTTQKALSGDMRAISMLADWTMRPFEHVADEPANDELSPDDESILQQFLADHAADDNDPQGDAS
jgi:hypothetical protein